LEAGGADMKKFLLGFLAVISLGAQAKNLAVGDTVVVKEKMILCSEVVHIYNLLKAYDHGQVEKAKSFVDGERCMSWIIEPTKVVVQEVGDEVVKVAYKPNAQGWWIPKGYFK
jgi:hypothetical protein